MKFFTGSLATALVLMAAGAQAQTPHEARRAPYAAVSDFGGPYVGVPHEVPGLRYGPSLLPATEVYTVLRENGFSPLGIPRLRGWVYTIAVIDRGGEDGRLVISARDGRIIRFVPAWRAGGPFEESSAIYAPGPHVMAPQVTGPQGTASPPSGPKVASHSVPIPKAKPLAAKPLAASDPAQAVAPQPKPAELQAAAPPAKPADVPAATPQPKPTDVQAAAPQAVTTGSAPAKPAADIAPTRDMPGAQGLE